MKYPEFALSVLNFALPLTLIALAPAGAWSEGAPAPGMNGGVSAGEGSASGNGAVLSLPGSTLKATTPGAPATVLTNQRSYSLGSPVEIAFRVANHTANPIEYDFSNGQKYDFEVRDARGKSVWQWSHGASFPSGSNKLILKPGESTLFSGQWDARVDGKPAPPGRYIVTGRLTTQARPAVRGGILVNPDRDPNNIGVPTRSPVENGEVVQVPARYAVTATTDFQIAGAPSQ